MSNVSDLRRRNGSVMSRVGSKLTLILLLGALIWHPARTQTLIVTHIRPSSDTDVRNQYFIRMLDLALSKTKGDYKLVSATSRMHQGRALAQLKSGVGLDVVWTMTSKRREEELLPIRIPLLKGLIGTRLLLINKSDANKFSQITAATQLQKLRAVQGHDWPDIEILRHNGYTVGGAASYDGLFRMLQKRRIDYFPRSVEEIWQEAETHADIGIAVDKSIVMQYPAAIYFFVKRDNHLLARRLEDGLNRAIADGSFEEAFLKRFNEIIAKAGLSERYRIDLVNPLLTDETPLDRAELWFQY